MTKRHFEALAAALKGTKPPPLTRNRDGSPADIDTIKDSQWRSDVRAIAEVLLAHNPRFDTRFYAACGYEIETLEAEGTKS